MQYIVLLFTVFSLVFCHARVYGRSQQKFRTGKRRPSPTAQPTPLPDCEPKFEIDTSMASDEIYVADRCRSQRDAKYVYDMLKHVIQNQIPFSLGKVGGTEARAMDIVWTAKTQNKSTFDTHVYLATHSGVWPLTTEVVEQWSQQYFDASNDLNITVRWTEKPYSVFEQMYLPNQTVVHYVGSALNPFAWEKPYTELFEGKTVLIMSLFEDYIRSQYADNRLCIFPHKPSALPQFNLRFITTPHPKSFSDKSLFYYPNLFKNETYFDNMRHMKARMDETDYDIALIAAGSYGNPLAAYAKKQGKVALVVGGQLGPFFGLKGARFDSRSWYRDFYYNKCWSRMRRPSYAHAMENSAYW